VFKNETLREHKVFDTLYRLIRRLIYGRIVDIETFYVHVSEGKVADYCLFPKIYSDDNTLQADDVHLDTTTPYPEHPIIKWGTLTDLSPKNIAPIIYVNTSNHAMATHDTNQTLQKTLYTPTDKHLTVGFLTRKQVEKKYKKNRSIEK
jgi:hypothetical protein